MGYNRLAAAEVVRGCHVARFCRAVSGLSMYGVVGYLPDSRTRWGMRCYAGVNYNTVVYDLGGRFLYKNTLISSRCVRDPIEGSLDL